MTHENDDVADATALDPRALCLMHLRNHGAELTPAEVAYVLGNDADFIAELIKADREQEELASFDALEAKVGPDPDVELADVSLGEAREWAMDAQVKAAALDDLLRSPRPKTAFALADDLAAVRAAEAEWLAAHTECDYHWNETDQCPDHGGTIRAGRARQADATAAMFQRVRILAAGSVEGTRFRAE